MSEDSAIRLKPPAPTPAQLGNVDLDSWRAVPGEDNPEKLDWGRWAVAGGDEVLEPYIEIVGSDTAKQIAEFIVDAVQQHARKLWAEGAMADVLEARQQVGGEDSCALFAWGAVCDLVQQVSVISAVFQDGLTARAGDRPERLYPLYARLAATLLMHMEQIRANDSNYSHW
ncbi:hypothetical protein ACQP2T_63560 (plasmid) [Nonomuraea sp. CA-143628]|uniref:hypothetical protein n=1 Tax=Nonomuraea sp. CA-143628 TaxID=3239997 RepID=UPI003D8F2D67